MGDHPNTLGIHPRRTTCGLEHGAAQQGHHLRHFDARSQQLERREAVMGRGRQRGKGSRFSYQIPAG